MRSQPVPDGMGLNGTLICSPQTRFRTIIGDSVPVEGVPCNSGSAHAVKYDIRRAEYACRHGRRGGDIVYTAEGLV